MSEPNIIQKKAIDVTPYCHGMWCSFKDGEPFINTIVHRKWSEDGKSIWFGLDFHNFYNAEPEELVNVVEIDSEISADDLKKIIAKDTKIMANRQPSLINCPCCKGTGKIREEDTWELE